MQRPLLYATVNSKCACSQNSRPRSFVHAPRKDNTDFYLCKASDRGFVEKTARVSVHFELSAAMFGTRPHRMLHLRITLFRRSASFSCGDEAQVLSRCRALKNDCFFVLKAKVTATSLRLITRYDNKQQKCVIKS